MTTISDTLATAANRLRRPHGRRTLTRSRYLFVLPALLFIFAMIAYPVGYNVYLALHDVNVGNLIGGDQPFVGLGNFSALITDAAFVHSFEISLLFTLASLTLQFSIGFALALLFNKPFPGNRVMRALILLGWLLPIVVTGNVWRWMLDGSYGAVNAVLMQLGLLHHPQFWLTQQDSALIGVVLANAWIGIPFNMILLLAGLQAIPATIYEAAALDGAVAWRRLRHITLPLMRPVALTVLLLSFVYTFKVFDLIFVMTNGGPVDATTTLPVLIYKMTFTSFQFGEGSAAALVLFGISGLLALVYLWLIRREETA